MSKPIDQEREAFALIPVERSYNMRTAAIMHFNTARQEGKDLDDALDAAWRATLSKAHSPDDGRASVQPTGVPVPTGYVLMPVEPTPEMIQAGIDTPCIDTGNNTSDEWLDYKNMYAAMLAAAPHPVSGEQKAQDVDGLALIEAGNPLSNVAYNLAQKPGHALTAYDCELLAELRKRWDAALATHRTRQGELEP